jgi:hypothetical protein
MGFQIPKVTIRTAWTVSNFLDFEIAVIYGVRGFKSSNPRGLGGF